MMLYQLIFIIRPDASQQVCSAGILLRVERLGVPGHRVAPSADQCLLRGALHIQCSVHAGGTIQTDINEID